MLIFPFLIYSIAQLSINLIRKVTTDDRSLISFQKKQKCHCCGNFLSYFPIVSTKNGRHICGRCTPLPCNGSRNIIYESSISSIYFPCLYQNEGCPAKLLPEEVPKHEESCGFRVINCLFKDCSWRGASSTLIEHCENKHQEFILEEDKAFELYLCKDLKDLKCIILHNDELLTITWTFNILGMKFGCLIKPYLKQFKDTQLSCRLTVEKNDSLYSIDFDTGKYANIFWTDLDINLQDEESRLIVVVLSFTESAQKLAQISWKQDKEDIMSSLQCLCLCDYCGKTECYLKNLKSTASVNIAKSVQYPCKNNAFGCTVEATPVLIESHQEICKIEDSQIKNNL